MISPRMICFVLFFQMFEVDAYLPHQSVVSLDNITIIVPNTDRVLISNFTYHFKQVCKCILHHIRKRTAITRININYKLLYDKVTPRSHTPKNRNPTPKRKRKWGRMLICKTTRLSSFHHNCLTHVSSVYATHRKCATAERNVSVAVIHSGKSYH